MAKKTIKEQGRQRYLFTGSKTWTKAEARNLINNNTGANLKQKTINTLEVLKKQIARDANFSKQEIAAINVQIRRIKTLKGKDFNDVNKVQKIFNYISKKQAKSSTGHLNTGIRGRTLSNFNIFTKAGSLRKRFTNRATNVLTMSQEALGVILARFLKGWVRRGILDVEKIWSSDSFTVPAGGVYKITFLGYDGSVFMDMLQAMFGASQDDIFLSFSASRDNAAEDWAEAIIRPEFTMVIDRYVESGWQYGGN